MTAPELRYRVEKNEYCQRGGRLRLHPNHGQYRAILFLDYGVQQTTVDKSEWLPTKEKAEAAGERLLAERHHERVA